MKFLIFMAAAISTTIQCHASTMEPDTVKERLYLDNGLRLINEGKYDSAFKMYQRGTEVYLKTNDSIGYGKCLYGMGIALHYPGKSKEALPYYFSSFAILKERLPEIDPFIGNLNNNIGAAYIDMGNRFVAKKYLLKALEIDMELNGKDSVSTAVTSYNLGLIAMYFGEHQEGLQYFMDALPPYLNKYGKNGSRVAQLYTNVGLIHYDLCDYDLAREYYDRAINIHLENHGENYWNLAYPYTSLGELFEATENDDLALSYYLKALKLTDSGERDLTRLKSILNGLLGKLYGKSGDYEKGLKYLETAINLLKETYFEDHPRLSDFYRLEGNIYKKQGDFEKARLSFEKANDIIEANYGQTHPTLAKNYAEAADMYLQMGQYENALANIENGIQSITLQLIEGDFIENQAVNSAMDERELLNLIILRGKINRQISEHREGATKYLNAALDDFSFASSIIDHIRRELLSEGSKLFLQKNAVYVYEQALKTCYELHSQTNEDQYIHKAFYFLEKGKGAVLSEALQEGNLKEVKGIPRNVLAREKEINRYIKSIELKLAESTNDEQDSLKKALTQQLFHAKVSQDSLARIIKNKYPDYYDLKYNDEVVSLEMVQKIIDKNTLVASFFEGDSAWYVLGITNDSFQLNTIQKSSIPQINLNQLFRDMSNSSSDIMMLSAHSYQVYHHFIAPLFTINKEIKKMIFVPDGLLCYIPFGALVIEDPSKLTAAMRPTYMIEKYAISYASSLTLNSRNTGLKSNENYIGFAPVYGNELNGGKNLQAFRDVLSELTGTQEEVQKAGQLFEGKVYLAENATEFNFKKIDQSPVIMHLAMHAIVDDKDPMHSKLIFSQASDTIEDSELNAYEIYGINLGSQLAVLSACNTGFGELNRGEGVMSLSRAFIYAGSPNIVMSLWRAKDQPTTEIMFDFFQLLKKEMPKDKALQLAKINYIKKADPLKAHPANWATFVLLGNSDPLKIGTSFSLYWLVATFFLLVLAFYFYRMRKNA